MTEWFRSWHGAPTDPKWVLIGKKAGVAPAVASAIAWAIFDHASQASPRGSSATFDCEVYAAWGGLEPEQVEAAVAAMRERGMILTDGMLASWRKRQPEREDGSAERARAWRERRRTQKNETERPEQNRTEQNRDISKADASLGNEPDIVSPVNTSQSQEGLVSSAVSIEKHRGKTEELRQALRSLGEQWNALAASFRLPEIEEIKPGSTRERQALARLREAPDCASTLMSRIRGSPYLRGEVNGFRCSFDWIIKPTNFQKIMEGNYEDRKEKRSY